MYIKTNPLPLGKKSNICIGYGYRDHITHKVKFKIVESYGCYEKLLKSHPEGMAYVNRRLKELSDENPDIGKSYANVKIDLKDEDYESNPLQNIGYLFLEKIYRTLKIDKLLWQIKGKSKMKYDLNTIVKLMVYKRILSPCSKIEMFKTKDEIFNDLECCKNNIYDALSVLFKHKDWLIKHINSQMIKKFNRTHSNVYYDVTNFYFEIDNDDEDTITKNYEVKRGLRKKGLSKENRHSPIVQMGFLVDNNGIPIAYDQFPGNHCDTTTLKPFFNKYKSLFNEEDITIVADKGLNSRTNLGYIDANKHKYIVAQRVRGASAELLNELKQVDWSDAYREKSYLLKSFIHKKTLNNSDGTTKIIDEKVVVFWSKNFYDKQTHEREQLMAFLQRYINTNGANAAPNGRNVYKKYIKIDHMNKHTKELVKVKHIPSIMVERLKEDKELDGIYLIVTNNVSLSSQEIVGAYHDLWKIENSFKVLKTDFKTRPIRHSLENRIGAHFFTCFIALILSKLLQQSLNNKYSIQKLSKALKEFQVWPTRSDALVIHWPLDKKNKEVIKDLCSLYGLRMKREGMLKSHYNQILKRLH